MRDYDEFEEEIEGCEGSSESPEIEEILDDEAEEITGGASGWSSTTATYLGTSFSKTTTASTYIINFTGKLASISSVSWEKSTSGSRCYWAGPSLTVVRGTKGTNKLKVTGKKVTGKKFYTYVTITFK